MIQWLAHIPLYVPLGMALLALNLLVAYVALVQRLPAFVLGGQGAFMAVVPLLPTGGLTYLWAFTCALLFLIIGAIMNLRGARRAGRRATPGTTTG